jgi:hypothetical protein
MVRHGLVGDRIRSRNADALLEGADLGRISDASFAIRTTDINDPDK